jgi:tetratricopeptide (TPR) repeat protein
MTNHCRRPVQIMYNALTHTFQSQRLLRHLARALVARGSHVEAGKAINLYVELFDKCRQTDAAQVAKDLRRLRRNSISQRGEDEHRVQVDGEKEKNGEEEEGEDKGSDIDSDREFVRTLTFGTRLFCKYLGDPRRGWELASRAREVFDEKKDETLVEDKGEESRIERALGVALGALTAKGKSDLCGSRGRICYADLAHSLFAEADLESRPANHAQALKHLESAASLDPTSWETLYHLAYQLAELRQIGTSKDAWHLLGLLVAAQKDLGASLQVLETALDDELPSQEADDSEGSSPGGLKPNGNGVAKGSRKMYLPGKPPVLGGVDARQLDAKLTLLPAGKVSTETDGDFARDDTERLASEVQIRMTKNVVIEAMEGPEAALLDQQSLLAFFAMAFAEIKDVPGTFPLSGGWLCRRS